jgi:hypothetical protein
MSSITFAPAKFERLTIEPSHGLPFDVLFTDKSMQLQVGDEVLTFNLKEAEEFATVIMNPPIPMEASTMLTPQLVRPDVMSTTHTAPVAVPEATQTQLPQMPSEPVTQQLTVEEHVRIGYMLRYGLSHQLVSAYVGHPEQYILNLHQIGQFTMAPPMKRYLREQEGLSVRAKNMDRIWTDWDLMASAYLFACGVTDEHVAMTMGRNTLTMIAMHRDGKFDKLIAAAKEKMQLAV